MQSRVHRLILSFASCPRWISPAGNMTGLLLLRLSQIFDYPHRCHHRASSDDAFLAVTSANPKCPSGVRRFYTNKEADAFNIATAEACTEYAIHGSAVDTICGHRSGEEYAHVKAGVANISKVEMANLTHKIFLCMGKPCIVIHNIDVSDSLVNGSVGIPPQVETRCREETVEGSHMLNNNQIEADESNETIV
ncbi:hypothetical protein HPB49_005197 [Dermacentor silvarum]|uniref:Uncharacterized protein n=1 Tax=Dermacentor silvarum TaxID=543639 RepID=A0ACB8DUM8_DERSI|nr:hypothetical protein HPB49_005197 [Dermacentor silvarum]